MCQEPLVCPRTIDRARGDSAQILIANTHTHTRHLEDAIVRSFHRTISLTLNDNRISKLFACVICDRATEGVLHLSTNTSQSICAQFAEIR